MTCRRWCRGCWTPPAGEPAGGLVAQFYDEDDGLLDTADPIPVWQNPTDFAGSSTTKHTFNLDGDEIQVGLEVRLDKGRLAYSDLALAAFADAFYLSDNMTYELTAAAVGINADMALAVVHGDLTPLQTIWNDANYISSGEQVWGTFIAVDDIRLGETAVFHYRSRSPR